MKIIIQMLKLAAQLILSAEFIRLTKMILPLIHPNNLVKVIKIEIVIDAVHLPTFIYLLTKI